jgi:mRNA interferase RelE/StbE
MWKVEYTKRFYKDMAVLPKAVQERIEPIVFEQLETDNPFELGFLEKMKGYSDKYKFLVGDYRVGLTLDKENQVLICERVAHRREVYRVFP